MERYDKAFKNATKTLLEYYKGDLTMSANASSVRKGGKSIMRGGRKHQNLLAKDYKQKNAIIDAVRKTGSDRHVAGGTLQQVLKDYDLDFEPNKVKTIGNSGIAIAMFICKTTGAPRAIVHKKEENRSFQSVFS